jgi:hypothetical protein
MFLGGNVFSVELHTRTAWLNQDTEILLHNMVIFYTDGSLCDYMAGAGVFSEILNVRESYALGKKATVFQTEEHAVLSRSDYYSLSGHLAILQGTRVYFPYYRS